MTNIRAWLKQAPEVESALIVGIGDNTARERVAAEISKAGIDFVSAVHSSVQTGSGVSIGKEPGDCHFGRLTNEHSRRLIPHRIVKQR